ncbi:CRISPR-associated endoribonuclease Cas6 [Laceyella tengchongensis]|uniref:CRISPR-associated endoribonuclease Cas6 n=1 Tax=Laceyella tengchongensis TaxID=574699 RepID=UPI0018902F98
MRVEVTFHIAEEMLLPYDLNYPISSFIYHCVMQADPDLAQWLHDTGLEHRGKKYKPFVFSRCYFTSRINLKSAMKVKGSLAFQLDSIKPEIVQRFIEGVWRVGQLSLNDAIFPLADVRILPPVPFERKMVYQALGSIVVPTQIDGQVIYCHPLDSQFYDSMRYSLKNWYTLRWNEEFPEEEILRIQLYRPEKFNLKKAAVLTRYKEKNLKGYQIPLVIETSTKMHQVIYESGLGSYGSQGFGMVSPLKGVLTKNNILNSNL